VESKINDGAITVRQIRRPDNDTIEYKFPKTQYLRMAILEVSGGARQGFNV